MSRIRLFTLLTLLLPLLAAAACFGETPAEKYAAALNAGKKAFAAKQHKLAEKHFLAAATIGLSFGDDDERYAAALDHLGSAYAQNGKYKDAEETLEQALEIIVKSRDKFHPDLLATLQNLAIVQRTTKQWDAAVETSNWMLKIVEAQFGDDHLNVATIESNIAAIEQQRQAFDKAEKHLIKALEVRKKQLKEDDPLLRKTYRDLGNTCLAGKKFAKAEQWYAKMLAVVQKASPGSLDEAEALQKMAQVHEFTKQYRKALPLIEKAHAIRVKQQGDDHVQVGQAAFTLSRLYMLTRDFKSAEPMSRSAMEIFRKKLGDKHAFYAVALINHATLLQNTGRSAEASQYLRKAQAIRQQGGK